MSPKKPQPPKTLRITSDYFTVQYEGDEGLRCCMRLDYNASDGIQIFVSKKKDTWELHSTPFPGELPKKELDDFIGLWKRSIRKFSPKAKFKKVLVSD